MNVCLLKDKYVPRSYIRYLFGNSHILLSAKGKINILLLRLRPMVAETSQNRFRLFPKPEVIDLHKIVHKYNLCNITICSSCLWITVQKQRLETYLAFLYIITTEVI
jgi:hypothetical protein